MELWIRSQNKGRLSKIKDIYIADIDKDVAICGYSSDESDDFDLGIYPTIERALEVLDEIQDKLKVSVTNEAGAEFILARNLVPIVYEMPED